MAAISAHNNPTIGDMVAEAVEKVGTDGAITVEESKTTETLLQIVEGIQFPTAASFRHTLLPILREWKQRLTIRSS